MSPRVFVHLKARASHESSDYVCECEREIERNGFDVRYMYTFHPVRKAVTLAFLISETTPNAPISRQSTPVNHRFFRAANRFASASKSSS